MKMPHDFRCPPNMIGHLQKVFDGEYDIPLLTAENSQPLKILDLGANCGAFALWAQKRWPGSFIFCYEPMPETFEFLKSNLEGRDKMYFEQVAIFGHTPGEMEIYAGKNNIGEASLFKGRVQVDTPIRVKTLPAKQLPHADIIKLDVEGAELEILFNLIAFEQRTFSAVLLEYHSEPIRRMLEALLSDYWLVRAEVAEPGRGTLCYVHCSTIRYPSSP